MRTASVVRNQLPSDYANPSGGGRSEPSAGSGASGSLPIADDPGDVPFDVGPNDKGPGGGGGTPVPPAAASGPQPVPGAEARPAGGPGGGGVSAGSSKIRTFEQKLAGSRHEDSWSRTPNATGMGAIHVKSFHCKLTGDSLAFLDQQINEWLDAHPQYEVKLVTTSIGTWTGKLKEPNLIVNVWV